MAERRSSKGSKSPDSRRSRKAEEEEANDGKQDQHQKKTGIAGAARWVKKRATGQPKSSPVQPVQHEERESTAAADTSELQDKSSPPPLIEEEEEEQHTGQWAQWQQPSSTATGGLPQHVNSGSTRSTGVYQDKKGQGILPDRFKPVPSSAEGTSNYDKLDPAEIRNEVTRPRTQPLPVLHVPHQLIPEENNLAQELAKAELERDRYKRDIENKERQIQEYHNDIVKLKTQLRTSSPRQQQQQLVVDHSAVVQLEEKEKQLTALNRQLVEYDTRVGQLEREKEKSENNATTLSKQIPELKQSIAEKDEQLAAIKKQLELQEARNRALMKEYTEHQTVKKQLESSGNEVNELKSKMEKLEKEREDREKEIFVENDQLKHQLQKQVTSTTEAREQADAERSKKERLHKMLEESVQEVIDAKQKIEEQEKEFKHQMDEKDQKYEEQLGAKEKQIRDLTTAIEEQGKQFKGQLEEKEREIHQKEEEYQERILNKDEDIRAAVEEQKRQFLEQLNAKGQQIIELTAAIEEQARKHKGQLETKGADLQTEVTRLKLELDKTQREIDERKECEKNLRAEMKLLQEKAGLADEGASANNSLSEEEKEKRALETLVENLREEIGKVEKDMKEERVETEQLKEQVKVLNDEKEVLTQHYREQERKANRATTVVAQTAKDYQTQLEKKDKELEELQGELSQIGTESKELLEKKDQELTRYKEELNRHKEEKDQVIAELKKAVEERSQTVSQLRKQLKQKVEAEKEKAVAELVEKLQVKEQECAIYKMDFETERNDRQRIHDELEQFKTENASLKELKQVIQKMTEEAKTQEEEIQILTAQVNAYSRKGDELKRALTQSQERYKTLETDKKTSVTEVSDLKGKLDSERNAKEQLENQLTILRGELESKEYSLNQEQARVTSLQQEVSKLQNLNERMRNANQVLVQKLKVFEQQQPPVGSPRLPHTSADNKPHSNAQVPPTTTKPSHIAPRSNIVTLTSPVAAEYNVQAATEPIVASDEELKTHNPNTSGSISGNVAPPAMNREQMLQLFKPNQDEQQRQKEIQLKEQQERQLMEQQERERLSQKADDALQELDQLRKERSQQPASASTGMHQQHLSTNSTRLESGAVEGEQKQREGELPYDPNLVCPKCGKRFRIGGVQKFRHHVTKDCTASSS